MGKGCNNASNKKSNSSKPYDASNSFVKKVASHVTGLIPQTSWLSGWFSSADVSNRPEAAQSARFNSDGDTSKDPDQPPPPKRIKLPDKHYQPELFTPASGSSKDVKQSSQEVFLDMSCVPGPSGQQSRGTGNFVASTPAEQELKANGDDCSESAESTSGCSSLEPQMNRGPGVAGPHSQPNDSLPSRFPDDRFNYPSYLQSPRSLFLDRSNSSRNNQSASRRKPSFSVTSNCSLFGDRSLNETMVNSPFYSGRTMYGGASSSPYRRSKPSTSFTSPASSDKSGRHTVRVKPSPAQANVDTGMSETARRILATLEQFSTPLLDAKRIPVSTTPQPVLASSSRKRARHETEEPRILLNPPRSPHLTRKGVHWAKGPPIQELSVPTTPDTLHVHRKERIPSAGDEQLLRQKERLQDSTTAARRLANSVPASNIGLERTYTLRSVEDDPPSGKQQSLKMRQPRTKVHQSRDDKKSDAPVEVNLPKIALPFTTLPSFDIPVSKPASVATTIQPQLRTSPKVTSKSSASQLAVTPSTTTASSTTPKPAPKGSSAPFTFASPIVVVSSDLKPVSPVAFVFSKPDPVGEERVSPATGLNFLPSVPSQAGKPGPKRKSVTVNENGSDAVGFSLKPPSELRTGSVMDILGKGAKDTKEVNGSVSLMDKFKPAAGTWECDQCLVRNKADLSRCAACTSPRPAAGGKATSHAPTVVPETPKGSTIAPTNDSGFGAKFKLTGSDMWECSSCMVRNKTGSSECVACGTGKPVAPQAVKPTSKPLPTASNWGDKFKPASNTWECGACMVRNASELTACQACTTKRPGAGPAVSTTSSSNTTSATTSSWGDKFKKAEGSWDCSDCMITNQTAALKCVACGAKKPGTQGEDAPASTEQPKFMFGIPAGGSGFSFGIKPSEKTEEKPASSSGFKIGAPAASVPTTGFSFGIPPAASTTTPASVTPSSSGTATTTVTTSSSTPAPAKPLFSFGVPKQPADTTPKSDSTQEKVATFSFGQAASESSEPSRKRKSTAETSKPTTTTTSTEQTKEQAPLIPVMIPASATKEATVAPTTSNAFSASPAATKPGESATPPKPAPMFGFSANSPASLFKFGADSNTGAATPPKTKPAPASEEPKPSQETKPFFGAASTPALNSTFAFGQGSSETPKPAAVPTFGASTDATTPAKPFAFGQSSLEALKTPKAAEAPKPAEMFSAAATTKPAFMFGQSATEAKPAETPKPSVTFGATPASDQPAPEKPAFNFQPSSDTAPKPLSGFGNPSNTSATPMFGASSSSFPTFGSSSSTQAAIPTFGSSASTTPNPAATAMPTAPAPLFGAASSVPTFGSSFGSTEKAEPKPGVFTFGAAKPAAAGPFTFGAPAAAVNGPTFGAPSAAKPFSAFNAAPTNSAPASTPSFGGFAATSSVPSTPAFGASASNATSLFGNNSAPGFGAPTQTSFNAPAPAFGAAPSANPAPAPASQFNFQANTSSTPVFTFGGNQMPQTPAPSGPFSFTAKPVQAPPTFNPNATPNFNFTAGGAVNFTATPGEVKQMPPRVIKKAMRRTQPR